MKPCLLALVVAATLGAGCKNRLVFATHTSLGLDVSGTAQVPDKVSLSYNRYEVAIVPRKTNGEAHSVFGGMDADMKFFGGQTIKQTFATGKAAMNATDAPPLPKEFPSKTDTADYPLVFATGTTFGLHLSAGEGEVKPSLLLGYRRSEAVTIPVPDPAMEARSVYADILINTSSETNTPITTNFSALGGVLIKQTFATGRAAESLALGDDVRAKLKQATGVEATSANLRRLQARSEGVAADIRLELDRLEDAQLPQAVSEFAKAGFISQEEAGRLKPPQYPPRTLCRKLKEMVARQTEGELQSKETFQELQQYLAALRKIQ
jgi:hypothetical protein